MTPQELAAARRKLRLGFEPTTRRDRRGRPTDEPRSPRDRRPHAGRREPTGTPAPAAPEPEPEPEPEPRTRARAAPLRVANCSGFYGDRLSAAREMVEGGPIDVLTGDWLAELTMLILAKGRLKDPDLGFATTFLTQMEQVLGTCLAEGIRSCQQRRRAQPGRLRRGPPRAGRPARPVPDDRLRRRRRPDAPARRAAPPPASTCANIDTGETLDDLGVEPVTANAYLGGWGIVDGARPGRRRRDHRPGHRRRRGARAGGLALRLGAHRLGPAGRRASSPATSSSAAPSAPAATTRSSTRSPASSTPASPSPRSHDDGSFVVTKHPGTGGARLDGHGHRPAALRDPGPRVRQPRRGGAPSTRSSSSDEGPDRVRVLGRRRPARARDRPRSPSTTSAATATR